MNRKFPSVLRLFIPIGSLVFCAFLSATPAARIQDPPPPAPAPDDTKANKDRPNPTSDQQKMNPADRATTQQIRKAIHDDKDISTYAHNIKVTTQDGKVILRGPVRSEDEKAALYAKAVSVVGQENVTNMLDVIPSK
jgi:hyperosmotically inducible periplasmic protein